MNSLVLGIPRPPLLGSLGPEMRCEFLRALRNPALAVPIMLLPTGLYALFAVAIFGDGIAKDPDTGTYLFVAFALMALTMPALFTVSSSVALDRELGLMRLRRAQPASFGIWLTAKIAVGVVLGTLSYLPMVVLATALGKLSLDAGSLVSMSFVLLAGAAPFSALGLMIGSLVKGTAAPGYANLAYLPGCYLSGMFFPLPKSMYWQAPFWPQFHVEQLAMHAAGATKFQFEPVGFAVGVLVAFTVTFAAVAVWRLSRGRS